VLVGYACERHSSYQKEALLWSSGSEPTASSIHAGNSSTRPRQGVKITSTAALRALEDAQLREDDETLTEGLDESVMETASTQTTVEDDPRHESKTQGVSNHDSNLVDFRSRLRYPRQYIMSWQELEEKVWSNSIISMYTSLNSEKPLLVRESLESLAYIPYPLVPSVLQDVIPNRLSDDSFTKDPTNTSDEEISAICQSTTDRTTSSHLNSIRTCRNVILRTFLNLKLLQQSNFCAGSFSIIILDRRRQNVAILLPIEIRDFIALVYEIEYILRDSASLVLNANCSTRRYPKQKETHEILALAEVTSDSEESIEEHTKRMEKELHELPNSQFDFLKTPMVKQYCTRLLQIDPESSAIVDLGVVCIFS
jgi:hypothetical protein